MDLLRILVRGLHYRLNSSARLKLTESLNLALLLYKSHRNTPVFHSANPKHVFLASEMDPKSVPRKKNVNFCNSGHFEVGQPALH